MTTIKLFRIGRKNRPYFRIVVMEKRSKANGAYIEQIGNYDPLKEKNPITINLDLLKKWQSRGAVLSEGVLKLLKHYDKKISKTNY